MAERMVRGGDDRQIYARISGRELERRLAAKRREIARLRRDMRLEEAEMQALIAQGVDATTAAGRFLAMRSRLAQLLVAQAALMEGAVVG